MFTSKRGLAALTFVVVAASTTTAQPVRKDQYGDLLPPDATARIGTVRLRSGDDIDRVLLSPDGKLLITTRDHYPLQVWDAATGAPIREIRMAQHPHPLSRGEDWLIPEEIGAWAFSPDSRRLHVLTQNGILRACDVASGKWSDPLARTAGPLREDTSFCYGSASLDGTHFAYVPQIKPDRIEIFAIGKEKPILELKQRRGCQFSADNKIIALGLENGAVEVRELATNRVIATCAEPALGPYGFSLRPDGKAVTAVCFPKGKRLERDNTFTLITWDATTGKELLRVEGWKGYRVEYTPDGTKLFSANRYEREIAFADATTGKVTTRLKVHGLAGFRGIDFSKDGKRLVTSGGRDRSTVIWDLTTGKPALDFDAPRGPVCVIAFSPDGKTLFTGSTQEHPGWVWETETGKRKQLLVADGKGHPTSAAFTSDGQHVIVGSGLGEGWGLDKTSKWDARLWNIAEGKVVREFSGHTGGVSNLMLSPDGKQLVTRDRSAGSVRFWEVDSGKPTKVIPWVDNWVAVLAYPKAGELIGATRGAQDGGEVINLSSGKSLATWRKKEQTDPRAISPDGRLVACLERSKGKIEMRLTIRLIASGEIVCELPLESVSHHSAVAFSSDGRMIAVGGRGYTAEERVCVFDTATGNQLRTLRGHQGGISTLAFSHDGKRLASGSTDTTVLIWDLPKP